MDCCSLIEYKLRRYFYLGHEYSMYIPPLIRKSYWNQDTRHFEDVTGVRIIGKIVKKNIPEEINSIVPIILKVKKENELLDDNHLIFMLAVCAKFNLKQCAKMISDAYEAVSSICTDGLKLLMFVKFCCNINIILCNEGYISHVPSGIGNGFRKAMKKWYLSRDPLLTTEQIIKDPHYGGCSHKTIMKLISIQSDDPSQQIFITHTIHGMKKVEELFGSQVNDTQIENNIETFEKFQLKFIYDYLKRINNMKKMDETALVKEIELHRWGHEYKVIPHNMLNNSTILASLVVHMPLRDVLDNTFFFAKKRLFTNSMPHMGLWEYMLRFNNPIQLKKHKIHPIDSYLEYVKYSRTFKSILKKHNEILKKQGINKYVLDQHRIKYFIKSLKKKSLNNDLNSPNINTPFEKKDSTDQLRFDENKDLLTKVVDSKLVKKKLSKRKKKYKKFIHAKKIKKLAKPLPMTEENEKELVDTTNQLSSLSISIQQNNSGSILETVEDHVQSNVKTGFSGIESLVLLKQPPRLEDKLLNFLSKDLFKKTLKILEPTDQRILISYDNRKHMKKFMCASTHLLSVHEAITLITLSLFTPESFINKPTLIGVNESLQTDKINISDKNILSFKQLDEILFKESPTEWDPDYNNKNIPDIRPFSVMNWAIKKNLEYDVFIFLGTNHMDFRRLKHAIREYKKFVEKSIRIIVCCLNGKHSEQRNLGRDNMLFISGFDKNVGKLIHSFINGKF